MRRFPAWPAVLAVAAVLAGCAEPGPGPGPSSSSGPGEDAPPEGTPVLTGQIAPLRRGYVANVSAWNPGPHALAVAQGYCVSGYGSWTAEMRDATGAPVDYRSPSTTQLSCPGRTGEPLPPGAYWNWTFAGSWETGECAYRHVCDNWWDGNVTRDGGRVRAPMGEYTWRFTFAYSVDGRRAERTMDLGLYVPAESGPEDR